MRTGKHEMGPALALAAGLAFGLPALGAERQHLSITQPGGMPGLPVMTGIHPHHQRGDAHVGRPLRLLPIVL